MSDLVLDLVCERPREVSVRAKGKQSHMFTSLTAAMASQREKSSSLTAGQKRSLVELIASNRVVLDRSSSYWLVSQKQEAWEKIAVAYNSAHPLADPKTSLQLKRAWEYPRNK